MKFDLTAVAANQPLVPEILAPTRRQVNAKGLCWEVQTDCRICSKAGQGYPACPHRVFKPFPVENVS